MKLIKNLAIPAFLLFSSIAGANAQDYDQSAKVVLMPNKRAILSSRVFSTLQSFKVLPGQIFKKGALLAELDDRYYQSSLKKAEAALDAAANEIQFTAKSYDQGKILHDNDNMSDLELEQRRFEMNKSNINQQQSASDLEIARYNYESCKIYAPFPGRVVRYIVEEYEALSSSKSGKQVIEIINDEVLKAVMYLPSSMFNKIKLGDKLTIKIDETGGTYPATVVEKAAEMDALSRTFELRAALDNSNRELRTGMVGALVSGTLKGE